MAYSKKQLPIAGCTALALLICAVFGSVVHHDFVEYDDQVYVTENPQVQAGLSWGGVEWAFGSAHAGNWIPLTWLCHMLDCQLFDLKPGWHHLTNLLLHTFNAALLFLLLERMTATTWPSALVAALFAVHPLHVESVAWVAERKDVLSTFFFLLTLLAYVKYVQKVGSSDQASQPAEQGRVITGLPKPENRQTRFYYFLTLVFFGLGLLSKPMLVTLPFVLLLLD